MRMRRNSRQDAGFTLMELMIVMAIIGILATLAVPSFIGALKSAREAVLREDLHVMRAAIDSYTMDKQKPPDTLDDLVQNGYLRSIPQDPMTRTNDSWVTDTSDAYSSVDQTDAGGISDVHSGSQDTGSDGQPYSAW
jgi:general secretion pathway protein G